MRIRAQQEIGGSVQLATISPVLQWRVSLLRILTRAQQEIGTGSLVVVTYHASASSQQDSLCAAVVARWSVAGSGASASGDDSVA